MPAAIATASPDQNSGPTEMAKVLRNLQHAVSQCQDSIFITDAAGVVTRVNPAFERLSGYTPLEFVGKDLSLIIEGGAQSVDYQHLWRRVFEEKQYTRTTKLKTKSGESREIELTITAVRGSRGGVVSLVGTGRRLHQAAALQQTQSQPRSGADPVTTRLCHDLRNMLLVVLARADLAGEPLAPDHPSRRHVENIKSAAQSAAALIHELTQHVTSERHSTESSGAQAVSTAQCKLHASSLPEGSNSEEPFRQEKPVTILLVEDEALIRESSHEFLEGSGFHVLSVGSGEEAVDLIRTYTSRIDVLVTDVALPQMSGTRVGAPGHCQSSRNHGAGCLRPSGTLGPGAYRQPHKALPGQAFSSFHIARQDS